MSRDARREQLVAIALPIAAERGFADLSLEDVAARADVTRNLLYHYFPRGRQDLAAATVCEAGRELSADWVIDDALSLTERQAANFARVVDHALTPTDGVAGSPPGAGRGPAGAQRDRRRVPGEGDREHLAQPPRYGRPAARSAPRPHRLPGLCRGDARSGAHDQRAAWRKSSRSSATGSSRP